LFLIKVPEILDFISKEGRNEFFTNEFFPKLVKQGCPENIFSKHYFPKKLGGYRLDYNTFWGENVGGKIAFRKNLFVKNS